MLPECPICFKSVRASSRLSGESLSTEWISTLVSRNILLISGFPLQFLPLNAFSSAPAVGRFEAGNEGTDLRVRWFRVLVQQFADQGVKTGPVRLGIITPPAHEIGVKTQGDIRHVPLDFK